MASTDVDATSRTYWQDPSAPDPTAAASRIRANQPADELDDLFNYDVDINDASRGANAEAAYIPARTNTRTNNDNDDLGLGLGIDDEIKVRKPRAPIAKLNEERLLSANGIPKLRRIAKDRFKFKGKGHEFTDVSRLLNNYQLWLDDLFPKAKFADGLAIIEKLGHKKRMQVMRKEWIDEGKPRPASPDMSDVEGGSGDGNRREVVDEGQDHARNEVSNDDSIPREPPIGELDAMDEDLYAEPTPPPNDSVRQNEPTNNTNEGQAEEPAIDELDELLAEDAARRNGDHRGLPENPAHQPRDEFADDEEAMAEMEGW